MLVLTRKAEQSIVIDGNITVSILRVKGGSIRLGIDAPPEVAIRRAELAPFLSEELKELPLNALNN